MSRPIKFRFYSDVDKVMYNLTLLGLELDPCVYEGSNVPSEFTGTTRVQRESNGHLMQLAGIYDGKEVYEEDIIKITDDCGDEYTTTVKFDEGAFSVDVQGQDYDITALGWAISLWENEGSTWEIIGTIYDNPSLLEVQP